MAYLALAEASFADGSYEETKKWAKLAIQMHPRAPIRRALMIACCVRSRELKEAMEHAELRQVLFPRLHTEHPAGRIDPLQDARAQRAVGGWFAQGRATGVDQGQEINSPSADATAFRFEISSTSESGHDPT